MGLSLKEGEVAYKVLLLLFMEVRVLIKSKYIYEKLIQDKLFLLNLITFKYIILGEEDSIKWKENKIRSLSKYREIINQELIVEDDTKLISYAMEKLSKKQNRNPNHVIYITDECNQRCRYCFENEIEILGKKNRVLSYEQIDKILDTINKINNPNDKKGNITVFGGEPLLEKNREKIKYLLGKLESNSMQKVDIVTNGLTLDSYCKLLNENKNQVRSLIVTLNGYKEIHEIVRGSINNPTFHLMINNIMSFLEKTNSIDIRINILLEKTNISRIDELLRYLKQKGIYDNKRVSIAFGRIQVRVNTDKNTYDRELPYEDYYSSIIDYYYDNPLVKDEMIVGSEVSILGKMYKFWKNNELIYPELKGCNATYPGRLCYFVDDYMYPCTEITGINRYNIGNYMKQGLDESKYKLWKEYTVSELEKCKECKFIGLCNGACPVTNLTVNNKINDVFCLNMEDSIERFIESLYKKGYFDELS